MKKTILAALAVTALLPGCSLIPEYLRPNLPVFNQYPTGPAYQGGPTSVADRTAAEIGWRDFFRQPELQDLIAKALDNNRDLRVAVLNIEQARATYRIQRAELFPTVDANASDIRSRTPGSLSIFGVPTVASDYNLNLGVSSWEVDLFGRLRSLEADALEQFLATEDAALSTRIALISQVAASYLTLLADRQLLVLTEDTLQAQIDSYALTKRRFDEGIATALDLAQARTSVETARANLALYTRQVAQDRNALELVVGAPLGEPKVSAAAALSDFIADLPAGVPSDLLTRRPDIRQAEHTLKAANANIGAARAAYFPEITLTATGGVASSSLSKLFQGNANAWSFGPQVTLPIFDWGSRDANYDSAVAGRDIAIAQYEKSIQTAFREVADALAARGTYGNQLEAQKALVAADEEYYRLSQLRYQHGTDSYLTVLDAQRTLYSAQQTQIGVELARLTNLVTLYQVLGGGVQQTTAPPAPEQP